MKLIQAFQNKQVKNFKKIYGARNLVQIRWDKALSNIGEFIGSDEESEKRQGGNKRIVYWLPNGEKVVANPYLPGNIMIPINGSMEIQMVLGDNYDDKCEIAWINNKDEINDIDEIDEEDDEDIMTLKYTFESNKTIELFKDEALKDDIFNWWIKII